MKYEKFQNFQNLTDVFFPVKYRGKDITIASRTIDRTTTQARATEVESSQLRVARVVSIDSHQKWLAEHW